MKKALSDPRRDGRPPGARLRPAEFGLGVGQCRLRQDACAGAARHPAAARRHRPVEDPVPDLYARRRRQHVEPRVLDSCRNGRCSAMPSLRAEIAAIDGRRPDADKLRRARQLFAEALETPGGLKIQTIHAFCESVLHQFPLEANIAGAFRDARSADGGGAVRRGAPRHDDRRRWPADAGAGRGLRHGAGARRRSRARRAAAEIVRKRDGLRAFIDAAGRRWHRPSARCSTNSVSRRTRPPKPSPRRSGRCRDFRRQYFARLRQRRRGGRCAHAC